jgi:predicted RNase H-like nuclease
MAAKKNIKTIEYAGASYEVDADAIKSVKIQRLMANADTDLKRAYDAIDAVCCGKLDDYLETIPEPDGSKNPWGASQSALNEFLGAAAQQVAQAKN